MKRDEPSNHVRLAATNALLNSLEFTRANFEKEVSVFTKIRLRSFLRSQSVITKFNRSHSTGSRLLLTFY